MIVSIMNHQYQMSRLQYKQILRMAVEQVPSGVYAIEKAGYAELRNDTVYSKTKLKELTRGFKQSGFKVYSNGL